MTDQNPQTSAAPLRPTLQAVSRNGATTADDPAMVSSGTVEWLLSVFGTVLRAAPHAESTSLGG